MTFSEGNSTTTVVMKAHESLFCWSQRALPGHDAFMTDWLLNDIVSCAFAPGQTQAWPHEAASAGWQGALVERNFPVMTLLWTLS